MKDHIFTAAYIGNLIAKEFPGIPTFSAADAAGVLTEAFMKTWDQVQETHVEDIDYFFKEDKVQNNLKELEEEF